MKALSVILGLFLVLLMVPMVSAVGQNVGVVVTGGHLVITDMDVKVGSKTDKNLKDGDKISEEAKPGDSVEFTIQFANNFSNSDDVSIDDIDTQITIEGIDDGDDMDEDAKEFDLDADDDKKVKISFQIPLEVDEDNFDVLITADGGTDKNGSQEVKAKLELEVKKEDDEVRFLRNSVSPSEVKCGRTVQLSVGVINTGSSDEDETTLEVSNADLGMNFKETFDLSNDAFDQDSKFSKTFTFTAAKDVLAGIYPIVSKVIFNGGSDTETETADLTVAQCEIFAAEEEEKAAKEEGGEVVVVQPPVQPTTPTGQVTAEPVTTPTLPATEEKSLFQTSGFLIALIAGEVLLVIVAILIVVAVFRRRRE